MNKDEILFMPEGYEIDKLIAEQIIGLDLSTECDGEMYNEDDQHWSCMKCGKTGTWDDDFQHNVEPRPYSTNIVFAWQIVNKFVDKEYNFQIYHAPGIVGYICSIEKIPSNYAIQADTAPLAICRAAILLKLEVKNDL